MPRKRPKLRPDAAEIAFRVMQEAVGDVPKTLPPGEGPKNKEAARRGRRGGKKGGPARADALSAERRGEIAKKAATTRWDGRKPAT